MTTQFFSDTIAHRFIKVNDFFSQYQDWETLTKAVSYGYNSDSQTLSVDFNNNSIKYSLLVEVIKKDTFRVRFNPNKNSGNYTAQNTRAVIQDNLNDLQRLLKTQEPYTIETLQNKKDVELKTLTNDQSVMSIKVHLEPFSIEVFKYANNIPFRVWQTADVPVYFTRNGDQNYAIIQAIKKPATAKYIGFGEQGGQTLSKNTTQLNYFNFDNMRYRQVYDRGPLDSREPLYHSDPFFFEFNGVTNEKSVNATFINNPGQILIDIGYLHSNRYMFGSRFGDLDYFVFIGSTAEDIVQSFTSIVGRSRLKPRYCLGYHQGCYGYENRGSLEWVVKKYRDYNIPLDGLHIDVDVQNNYQTFTVNEQSFYNPKEMFANLKALGIKCSTNITPIISNKDANYATYQQAISNQYFLLDNRYKPDDPDTRNYQSYGGGNEYRPNDPNWIIGFNSGLPYVGEVNYGGDLGTTGHYPDLANKQVRFWWGGQYQSLFNLGLEMVWQDMTTPAIRDVRGDMKGFPFRLQITDDFLSETAPKKTPAIEIWNLYSYNLHKATFHGLNNLANRDNLRNFIIGRGSFTGSHRFAGLWTGDNSSDWDFLKMNVSQVLSLGMCGVVICGQDIGGFEASGIDNGKWASPELLIRWTVAGAFLPWFRNHYVRKGRKEFQEPFMYEEWFNQYHGGNLPAPQDLYRMVTPICRHFIQLRYRLLQLFYDAMFENTITGLPICRPLFLNEPDDHALYNDKESFLSNQFFVGKDLLIAPILDPQSYHNNNGKRDIYLPKDSRWYCFMNNTMPLSYAVEGGTTIRDFDANINLNDNHINFIVPIYVRSGAIIPTIELEQYVGQLNKEGKPNPITINVYPGDCGEYNLYLDDGISRSSAATEAHPKEFGGDDKANNEYRKTNITHNYLNNAKTKRQITIKRIVDNYTPIEKYFFVAILHDPNEKRGQNGYLKSITINNDSQIKPLSAASPEDKSLKLVQSPDNAWYFNENISISFIKVFDNNSPIIITVDYY